MTENNPTPEVEMEAETPEEETPEVTEVTEPPTRDKTNADFARERVEKRRERVEQEALEEVKKLREEVQALKEPKTSRNTDDDLVRSIATKQEVSEFIADNPEFSAHKAKIAQWAGHDAYSKVPIDQIARMIAFDDSAKMGAKEEKEAEKNAQDTKMGGSTSAAAMDKKEKSLDEMSDDEVLANILPKE